MEQNGPITVLTKAHNSLDVCVKKVSAEWLALSYSGGSGLGCQRAVRVFMFLFSSPGKCRDNTLN
jgi:hypothetical protein